MSNLQNSRASSEDDFQHNPFAERLSSEDVPNTVTFPVNSADHDAAAQVVGKEGAVGPTTVNNESKISAPIQVSPSVSTTGSQNPGAVKLISTAALRMLAGGDSGLEKLANVHVRVIFTELVRTTDPTVVSLNFVCHQPGSLKALNGCFRNVAISALHSEQLRQGFFNHGGLLVDVKIMPVEGKVPRFDSTLMLVSGVTVSLTSVPVPFDEPKFVKQMLASSNGVVPTDTIKAEVNSVHLGDRHIHEAVVHLYYSPSRGRIFIADTQGLYPFKDEDTTIPAHVLERVKQEGFCVAFVTNLSLKRRAKDTHLALWSITATAASAFLLFSVSTPRAGVNVLTVNPDLHVMPRPHDNATQLDLHGLTIKTVDDPLLVVETPMTLFDIPQVQVISIATKDTKGHKRHELSCKLLSGPVNQQVFRVTVFPTNDTVASNFVSNAQESVARKNLPVYNLFNFKYTARYSNFTSITNVSYVCRIEDAALTLPSTPALPPQDAAGRRRPRENEDLDIEDFLIVE